MYRYTHVYIYIYIYMYIHTYTHILKIRSQPGGQRPGVDTLR